jgi:hypothetical protein
MLCGNQEGEWGVGFLAAELNRYGLRATFFTEVFAAEIFGKEALRPVMGRLLDADQDVQLHLHPIFLRYAEYIKDGRFPPVKIGAWPDAMLSYSEQEQTRLIEHGMDIFRCISGREPVAFRAGGYLADRVTLRCLAGAGIHLDSSANPAYGASFPDEPLTDNQIRCLEGVWEIPITVARTHFPDRTPLKHLEISALSFGELKAVLLAAYRYGMRHVVLILHSFSMVKPRDIAYELFRPDWLVIRRFRKLLEFLAENPGTFRARTFEELSRDGIEGDATDSTFLPDLGSIRPGLRKIVQAINRVYWI